MARQMYIHWRILHWSCRQSCTSTYSEEIGRRSKVRQGTTQHSERYTMESHTTIGISTSLSTTTFARGTTSKHNYRKQRHQQKRNDNYKYKIWKRGSKNRYSRRSEETTYRTTYNDDNKEPNDNFSNRKSTSLIQNTGWYNTWRQCKQEQEGNYTTGSTNKDGRSRRRSKETKNEDQRSESTIARRKTNHNSNVWGSTWGTSRTEATRATHLQQRRIRYRETETRNAERDGIHENTRCVRGNRCYKAHTSTNTRTWSRQHHRVKMGLQIQRRWSTSKDRSKRVHRTHRRPRWCVRKHTTVCSTQDTTGFESRQRLDCTSGWHIHSIPARTGSISRPSTPSSQRVLHKPQHFVEATQSHVRPAQLTKSLAGSPSQGAYRPRSQTTTVGA